jgi:replicative DNA helicase
MNEGMAVGKFSMEMQNEENASARWRRWQHPAAPDSPARADDRRELAQAHRRRGKLRNVAFYTNDTGGLEHQPGAREGAGSSQQARAEAADRRLHPADVGHRPRANRNAQLEEASRGLKSLAKELNIPIIALAQVNRGVEKEGETGSRSGRACRT